LLRSKRSLNIELYVVILIVMEVLLFRYTIIAPSGAFRPWRPEPETLRPEPADPGCAFNGHPENS
jgi:hypothetical protein